MVIYYSATGNSEYVAKRIALDLDDSIEDLFSRIKSDDHNLNLSSNPLIIVAPTYAWKIPRILNSWLKKADIPKGTDVYFLMTCGSDIGNATKYLCKLCRQLKLNYRGVMPVIMPENYIALFETPSDRLARKIIKWADKSILEAISLIKDGCDFPKLKYKIWDKSKSGIVNKLFYTFSVNSKKFSVSGKCVTCGKCVNLCPTNNIKIVGVKPLWGNKCTHCMSCISRCPFNAIEYGKKTKNRNKYVFPPDLLP